MRHEDEFNSSSYIPPKGDSFEFGSVYAKNDAEIVKENAALKTDLNSTKTNNDSVSAQKDKEKKEESLLDSNYQKAKSTSTVAKAASTTTMVVEAATIMTATTIVVVGTAAGLRTLIHPNAFFEEVFATAHTVRYDAVIEEAKEGRFKVRLFGNGFDESQEAGDGDRNSGEFSGLGLDKTYTLQIIQFEEGAESAILSTETVTTANYNKFNAWNFDGVADLSNDSFTVTLDYIDEGGVYSGFEMNFEAVDNPAHSRTITLEKTTDPQVIRFNEGKTPNDNDYIYLTREIMNYSFSYVLNENGNEERITVKKGKMLFNDKDAPKLEDFSFGNVISNDGYLPATINVNDVEEVVEYAQVEFVNAGGGNISLGVDNWRGVRSPLQFGKPEQYVGQEVTARLVLSVRQDRFYHPSDAEQLDYYVSPFLSYNENDGSAVIAEKKVTLTQGSVAELMGLRFSDSKSITDNAITAYVMSINDDYVLSDYQLVIECNEKIHRYKTQQAAETISIENDLEGTMSVEETYLDLITYPSKLHLEATKRVDGAEEKVSSPIQEVQFDRSTHPTLDSYNFYDYTTDGGSIFASFDVYAPDYANPCADIKIELIPFESGAYNEENIATCNVYDPTIKSKQTLSIRNLMFDIYNTKVRIKIYLNVRDPSGQNPYVYELVETIDGVQFVATPYVQNVMFKPYTPIENPYVTGEVVVHEPNNTDGTGGNYWSNYEIELYDSNGNTVRVKTEEAEYTEGVIAAPFSIDIRNSGIVSTDWALKYRVYCDSTFLGRDDKGVLQYEGNVDSLSVSDVTSLTCDEEVDFTNNGSAATININVEGRDDNAAFTDFSFVSSDGEVGPLDRKVDFNNSYSFTLAEIAPSAQVGDVITITLMANNRAFTLATCQVKVV